MANILLDNFEKEVFEKTISNAYEKYDKVVFVYDLNSKQNEISLSQLLKDAMPIIDKYENIASEKLQKNIFIAPRTWQKLLIKSVILACNSETPYEIFDSLKLS